MCGTTATGIVLRCTHVLVTDPTHISFSRPLLQGHSRAGKLHVIVPGSSLARAGNGQARHGTQGACGHDTGAVGMPS